MARIVFIQNLHYEFPGVEVLSASLTNSGHETDVIIDATPNPLDPVISSANIIAFSVMTGSEQWALTTGKHLKAATGAMIVFGGPHPTHSPDIIYKKGVDAVCRGEGEVALTELADRIDRGEDISTIPNFWIKQSGNVIKNEVGPLVASLDSLPYPDREIYYRRYPHLANNSHKPFMAGRGCPFSCSFCSSEALSELYRGKGSYVRLKSPETLIAEIEQVRITHPLSKIFFHDDTFVLNSNWLTRFLSLYEERIALPFYCQSRADTLTSELAVRLKKAGCKSVNFAVESGVDSIRCGILRKELARGQIIDAAKILKKAGIKVSTYNIVGVPGETVDDAIETIKLNIEIGADFPRCSFLTPYPGTSIAKELETNGLINSSKLTPLSQQSDLILNLPQRDTFINIHALFQLAVLFPSILPVIKRLIYLPCNPFFRVIWGVTYSYILLKSEGRSIKSTLPMVASLLSQKCSDMIRKTHFF